ncbi:MAG: FAD-dependent thymidylate synthase [Bradymonadales bacterium]|nr:FAD-dependent thymidylate synthase [Bradymonadales bacterium]
MSRKCDPERYTPEERKILSQYFTNLDGPVFALVNLPEVVKGALFARYSRSPKPLRRLFLDEFFQDAVVVEQEVVDRVGQARAGRLYDTVFLEYGDDSVAQLGAVHLACEGVSNILTKVLEWGRLMSYLEQSTRYIPYTDRPEGRWKYHVPEEVCLEPDLKAEYEACLDEAFETYVRWLEPMQAHFRERYPAKEGESEAAYQRAIRARALDSLRGLLPAATRSNVGIHGTGQAFEALLLRMRASPLREVQQYADLMLVELRKVIPAFMRRVDHPERGVVWSRYLAETARSSRQVASELLAGVDPEPRPEVVLSDFDREGEVKVVAAALYAQSELPDDQLLGLVRQMTEQQRSQVLSAYVGERGNRRHKPGRAFERTRYRFDILADYGAFRDLQRHRILTLEWQALSPDRGYTTPPAIAEVGARADWDRIMERSAGLYHRLRAGGLAEVAPYAVCMAYRVRFYLDMNAREAMHLIELRTSPQGHPSYRRICQQMHRLIVEEAGHRAIAGSMVFVDHSVDDLGRRQAENHAERRRRGRPEGCS